MFCVRELGADQVLGKAKATSPCPFLSSLFVSHPAWVGGAWAWASLSLSEWLVPGVSPAGPLRAGCRPVGIPAACQRADRQLYKWVISSRGEAFGTLPRILMGENALKPGSTVARPQLAPKLWSLPWDSDPFGIASRKKERKRIGDLPTQMFKSLLEKLTLKEGEGLPWWRSG